MAIVTAPSIRRLSRTALAVLFTLTASDAIDHKKEPTLNEPFQKSFTKLPAQACYSLFHRNGRFGCGTSSRESQTGTLRYFDTSQDKFTNYEDAFVLVVKEVDLTTSNVQYILANNKYGLLQGILVVNATQEGSSSALYASPEPQYPQGYGTPSENVNYGTTNYAWNSYGDGIIFEDLFGIPVSYLPGDDLSDYMVGVSQDNSANAAIVGHFSSYMGQSAMDSATCLSWLDQANQQWRPKCLPLGGSSVWAAAGSPETTSRRLEDESSSGNGRDVVMIATSIDATSLYRDSAPGANTAASNILTLLLAAKLVGSNMQDSVLDGLNKRIVFGFFQGESYGFIGSRAFLRDVAYPGFECADGMTVPSVHKLGDDSEQACLYPMRPSLEFQNLGTIAGMLTVDQVGVLANARTLYSRSDGSEFGGFLSDVLQASSVNNIGVSSADDQDDTYPPTPLTSLLQLSEGGVGGAILSGYNDAFVGPYYHSHRDSSEFQTMNLEAIATAATLLARTAVAAAYDDGGFDSDTASQYAANKIATLSYKDETLSALANCLYEDGYCDLLMNYAKTETKNNYDRTGIEVGMGNPLGKPPNYYVSVYDPSNGQPFVEAKGKWYGAYTGDDYGKKKGDAVAMRPDMLEAAIRGMLNDYLGRGSVTSNDDGSTSTPNLRSCSSTSHCSKVSYCKNGGDKAVCTGGGVCVCARSHYHIALDEALEAAANNSTGYFVVSDEDDGVSPMFTEPYWSSTIGVRVYRDAGNTSGLYALGSGIFFFGMMIMTVFLIKRKMTKQKLL